MSKSNEGRRVSGIYMGQVFAGVISNSRDTYGGGWSHTVELDAPIHPFNNLQDPRDEILLDQEQLERCNVKEVG